MRADEDAESEHWLGDEMWTAVQRAVPIACVDVVAVRQDREGRRIGLIQRVTPFDDRILWCQIGGRIQLGETVRDAVLRHLHEALSGVTADLPADPQPSYVMQWFPAPLPMDGVAHGLDPRRHAVALSFLVEVVGEPMPVPGGEAIAFAWLAPHEVRERQDDVWPGTTSLLQSLGLLGRDG